MLNQIYFIALVVFFVGWLIKHIKTWGDYVAIAGASLFVLVWLLSVLKLV